MNDTKDDALNNEELKKLENNLVKGADLLRANTGLKSSEYLSSPLFMYQFDLEFLALAGAYSGTGAALYGYIA